MFKTAGKIMIKRGEKLEGENQKKDQKRNIKIPDPVLEVGGAIAGTGLGVGVGTTLFSIGAAGTGTAGGAALTTGLAAVGSVIGGMIGGGIVSGIVLVSAPAVVLGVSGYAMVSLINRKRIANEPT